MSLGERIINAIKAYRMRRQMNLDGPHGDFYRSGGNDLLYEVPVTTGSLIIDAGGYEGEWTAKMIARYGCRSEVFEPFPRYAEYCKDFFSKNELVRVHPVALGGLSRTSRFSFAAEGTSEFIDTESRCESAEVQVVDVSHVFDQIGDKFVACLKLNIEGGEYEVLTRLITTKQIARCNSILIQFHSQPNGWEQRKQEIEERLQATHYREWCFPMVWEKWMKRDNIESRAQTL